MQRFAEGRLEAASGFEPLSKGFAVLGTGVTKSYQSLTISKGQPVLTGRTPTKSYQILTPKMGGKRAADFGQKVLYPTKTTVTEP